MQTFQPERANWEKVFDSIARAQKKPVQVTLEVDRADIGAQREVENKELQGLSYDPKGNTLAIRAGAVEHMIDRPASVGFALDNGKLCFLEVIGPDKAKHILTFSPPFELPVDLLRR
jgi:hypothetical protein